MSLLEHLEELRRRLVISMIALAVGSVPAWFIYEPLKRLLQDPYCSFFEKYPQLVPTDKCVLVVTGVVDAFATKLRIVLYLGLVLALPVVLYQLWAFVVPGLTARERRYAIPFIFSSLVLFAAGAAFAYLALPRGLDFLLGFAGEGVGPLITFDKYIGFVVLIILAFGLSFLLPVFLVFLQMVGVLSPQRLAAWRRWAFLVIFVFAAAITPTGDPMTLFALAMPMYLFYEAAIIIGRLLRRKRATDGDQG
jgi:sec-independent protein translocase protein TatC